MRKRKNSLTFLPSRRNNRLQCCAALLICLHQSNLEQTIGFKTIMNTVLHEVVMSTMDNKPISRHWYFI